MTRTIRLLAAGALALGAVATGTVSANALPAPQPPVPGACSTPARVPGTAASFTHCDRVAGTGRWAQWVEVTNLGDADVLQAQVRVRVGGRQGTASTPVPLVVPAGTAGRWDPLTGRRIVGLPAALRTCTPGAVVEPSVRLRDSPDGAWTAWVPARPFSCPR